MRAGGGAADVFACGTPHRSLPLGSRSPGNHHAGRLSTFSDVVVADQQHSFVAASTVQVGYVVAFRAARVGARDLSLQTLAAYVLTSPLGVSVSAFTRFRCPCPAVRLCESASPGPCGGPERLRWLIRRIADDDHDAFGELFDRCSGRVSAGLRRQVSDRFRAAGVLAGTFVEVWWLAGCHVDAGTDVMSWIDEIVQRRVADSRPAALSAAIRASPGAGSLGARWAQGVEAELAGLLRWRNRLR